MATVLAKMTKKELQEVIENALEHKLLEILGDPDQGLQLRTNIRNRLLRQRKQAASGERGKTLADVLRDLG